MCITAGGPSLMRDQIFRKCSRNNGQGIAWWVGLDSFCCTRRLARFRSDLPRAKRPRDDTVLSSS